MDNRQRKLIEAMDRVEEFLAGNHELMAGVISSTAHGYFSATRERMLAHMTAQETYARVFQQGVARKHALREQLIREHLRPIAAVAAGVLPNVREVPAFRVPKYGRAFLELVAVGYAMASAAKANEPALLSAGLAPNFVEKLIAASDALKASLSAISQTSGLRVEATAGLEKEGRVARRTLRILDTMVRAVVKDDNALLDRWTHLRRVASVAVSVPALAEGEKTIEVVAA